MTILTFSQKGESTKFIIYKCAGKFPFLDHYCHFLVYRYSLAPLISNLNKHNKYLFLLFVICTVTNFWHNITVIIIVI